jgi:hypothetical protein
VFVLGAIHLAHAAFPERGELSGQSFARPISFVASLSHNTELATTTQNVQSRAVNPTVPKARWRNGT